MKEFIILTKNIENTEKIISDFKLKGQSFLLGIYEGE